MRSVICITIKISGTGYNETCYSLAAKYKVSNGVIDKIRRGVKWKHVYNRVKGIQNDQYDL